MSFETSTAKKAQLRNEREPGDGSGDETSISGDVEKATKDRDNNETGYDVEKHASQDLPSAAAPATEEDPNLVVFDGPDDPDNPKNWTARRRIGITISMGMMTFVVTISSSIFASALGPITEEFDIGLVTATLGVALFLLGFVLGPIAFGTLKPPAYANESMRACSRLY